MLLRSIALIPVLAFTLFQTPDTHSPSKTNCTPGVSFWNLLDQVRIGYMDGRLGVGRLYAVCLPTPPRQSTSNYPYDPDGGGKLSTILKTADGKALNTYVWYAENISGLWEMSRYKVVGGYETVKPLAAGNYVLEFAIDDKPFYRFPISVVQIKSDDPYQPAGDRYFVEGPWNEYGNIFYQRNDPQSSLRFTTWVQDKAGHQNKTPVPYDVKLVSARDGRVLASQSGSLRLEPRWLKADLYFTPTGGEPNAYFKAGDLLREDGRYSIRLMLNNKQYGEYPFVVKGGRIELQGHQIREKTDPMNYIVDYLSGGRYTSWWIKRQ
ncbi:MAG TPA: hypothetical protein VLB68_22215 [Pyrinomonadaceae bacterium]|nr:hypothetical protein [Pyrinomonadaceae bacterium]